MALLPLSTEHLDTVLEWRNRSDIRCNMINQDVIEKPQHYAWFEKMCACNTEVHFVIAYRNKPIGAANLKFTGEHKAISGYYIGDDSIKGTAYAILPSLLLLEFAFDTLKLSAVFADVLSQNESAIRFNQKQGYTFIEKPEISTTQVSEQNRSMVHMKIEPAAFEPIKHKLFRFFDR